MSAKENQPIVFSGVVDFIVRLGVVVVLLAWAFQIARPFLIPVIWGIILTVAVLPAYQKLSLRLGGRERLGAVLTSLGLLLVILVPALLLADSLYQGVSFVQENWEQGKFHVPPPTEQVKTWPVVGEKVYQFWLEASKNMEEALKPFLPQLKSFGGFLIGVITGAGFTIVQFVFSIILAGFLLANAEACAQAGTSIARRLDAERGPELLTDMETTVRNVARGILGVAFIQAVLAGLGFAVAGVPGAGLWALLCLILGIIQVGVGPVMILAIIYLFSTASTLTASLFVVWTIMVVPLDNILKPILLGKGAPVPMLVIFLGSLGGFLQSGIIGLFVGAIVLSLAYKLLLVWLGGGEQGDVSSVAAT